MAIGTPVFVALFGSMIMCVIIAVKIAVWVYHSLPNKKQTTLDKDEVLSEVTIDHQTSLMEPPSSCSDSSFNCNQEVVSLQDEVEIQEGVPEFFLGICMVCRKSLDFGVLAETVCGHAAHDQCLSEWTLHRDVSCCSVCQQYHSAVI